MRECRRRVKLAEGQGNSQEAPQILENPGFCGFSAVCGLHQLCKCAHLHNCTWRRGVGVNWDGADGGPQFIALRVRALFFGGDPYIADQGPAAVVFRRLGGMVRGNGHCQRAPLQINKLFVRRELVCQPDGRVGGLRESMARTSDERPIPVA